MGIRYSLDEVFEMAAQIERNGGTFYRTAAKNNDEGRDLLIELAEAEDQHLALFNRMREEYGTKDGAHDDLDPDGQASLYLQAMANGHVFDLTNNDPAKHLKGDETFRQIIEIALQAEKDSIAFFVGLRELVPEALGKDDIYLLIKEEMQHITWLNEKLLA